MDVTDDAILGFRGPHFFLSNFYPLSHPLVEVFQGATITYPTLEHAYQAAKSTQVQVRLALAGQITAGHAKRHGRAIKARTNWDRIKDEVMLSWLRQKFADPHLGELLRTTGDATLVEVNHHGDRYWGTDVFLEGENRLGELLMQVREELGG